MSTDYYDDEHQETGSANISKATPEWSAVLAEARAERQNLLEAGLGGGPDDYVLHRAYGIVNRQQATGTPWGKCTNCGSPYKRDSEGADETVCSSTCWQEFCDYIQSELSY